MFKLRAKACPPVECGKHDTWKTHSLGNLWAAHILTGAQSVGGTRLGVTLVTAGSSLLGDDTIHQVSQVCFQLQIKKSILHKVSVLRGVVFYKNSKNRQAAYCSHEEHRLFFFFSLHCHLYSGHFRLSKWLLWFQTSCLHSKQEKRKKELRVKGQRHKGKMVKRPILWEKLELIQKIHPAADFHMLWWLEPDTHHLSKK